MCEEASPPPGAGNHAPGLEGDTFPNVSPYPWDASPFSRSPPLGVGPPSLLLPHARGGLRPRGLALAGSPARRFAAARAARAARRASRPAGPQGFAFSPRSRYQVTLSKKTKIGPQKSNFFPRTFRKNVLARVGYQRPRRASYKYILRVVSRASTGDECTHDRPPGGRSCCIPGIGGHRAPARVGPRPLGRGQSGTRGSPVSLATLPIVQAFGRVPFGCQRGSAPICI